MKWRTPTNINQLRGFLGLNHYYKRFICNYANIAHRLTELLKKDVFQWNEKEHEAFHNLKNSNTSAQIVKMVDFSKTFILEADALGLGFGAVIRQEKFSIAYFSKIKIK